MQETANKQANVDDPGHCVNKHTKSAGSAAHAQQQSNDHRRAKDVFLEAVRGAALEVDVLGYCPDDACGEECERRWLEYALRYGRYLMLRLVSESMKNLWKHSTYLQGTGFQAVATLEQPPRRGVVTHHEHAGRIQHHHP